MLDPLHTQPPDSATLSEDVFRRIQAAIVGGAIAPGSKISEPELARTYGISWRGSACWSGFLMSAHEWSRWTGPS
jgi:hypothetical protein